MAPPGLRGRRAAAAGSARRCRRDDAHGDRFPDEAAPHWSVDFWVQNVDAAAAKAVELGGTVLAAPFDSPVGRTAVLADPLGATLSVSKVNG